MALQLMELLGLPELRGHLLGSCDVLTLIHLREASRQLRQWAEVACCERSAVVAAAAQLQAGPFHGTSQWPSLAALALAEEQADGRERGLGGKEDWLRLLDLSFDGCPAGSRLTSLDAQEFIFVWGKSLRELRLSGADCLLPSRDRQPLFARGTAYHQVFTDLKFLVELSAAEAYAFGDAGL